MNWQHQRTIQLDTSLVFGNGYDFHGLENLSQEAFHNGVGYLIWPERDEFRVYETLEGGLAFASSENEAKAMAEKWALERERAALRAKLAALVEAGKGALDIVWVENVIAKREGNTQYEARTKQAHDQLRAAIAAAESEAAND